MRTSRIIPLALLLALPLVGCQDRDGIDVIDGAGPLGTIETPIYDGSPPDALEHEAVVSLHQLTKQGSVYVMPFCSGTLIAEDVVLTAAHCLNTGSGPKVRTLKPQDLAIYIGDEPAYVHPDGHYDIVDHLYATTETLIHPAYDPYALIDDIALVRLSTAPTEPTAPVPALPAGTGWSVGETLNFAGFGEIEDGSYGVKLQGDGALDGLGCTVDGCPGPGDAATQISYTQDAGSPCFGDSGGPAFVDRAGTIYVGGITSYGDADCLVYGVSTRVDAFESFIGDFVGTTPTPPDCSDDGYCNPECAAYEDPDCGGEPPPTGDCGNVTCDAGESCDGRDGTVACPADCDGLTTGKPSNRYC